MDKVKDLWTDECSRKARGEGWDLFDHTGDGVLELEYLADSESLCLVSQREFASDDEVLRYLLAKVYTGSAFHLLALYLDRRRPDDVVGLPSEHICAAHECARRNT